MIEDLDTPQLTIHHNLPHGWIWSNLGNITKNYDGVRVPIKSEQRDKISGIYPYYGASGIIDYTSDYLFEGEFLLIGEDGANLLARTKPLAFQAKGKFWVNNHAHVLRTCAGMPLSYMEYYINSLDLRQFITGTAQPKLTQAAMKKIPVPLAPLAEQYRIVSKLDNLVTKLDVAINSMKNTKKGLKKYYHSLLKYAFEGKLTQRWRESQTNKIEHASVHLDAIKEERKKHFYGKEISPLRQDDLPPIPDRWIWIRLQDIVYKINSGFPSGKHNKNNQGIPHLRPMNINERGKIDLTEVKYVQPGSYDRMLRGDVLFNNTNSQALVGKTAYVKEDNNWAYSNHMTRIRFNTSLTSSIWISYCLHTLYLDGFFRMNCKHHVNQSSIGRTFLAEKVFIPLPPLSEQLVITKET